MTLAELQAKIAQHAWEDPAFEAEFMANPKATFEKYMGQTLPAELSMHAHYNTPGELHFVIPQRTSQAGELTDADLERVAGGEIVLTVTVAVASALASAIATVSTTVLVNMDKEW